MPGYKAFVPGYLSPQNLTLTVGKDEERVVATPVQGSVFGPVEVDDPMELAAALETVLDFSGIAALWPQDAEDTYPEPVELEPMTVAPMPPQNLNVPGPGEQVEEDAEEEKD